MLSYDDIKQLVYSFQKSRGEGASESAAEAAVDAAINEIFRGAELPPLRFDPPTFDTVIGTSAYAIDGDVFKILMVEITEGGKKSEVAFRPWDTIRRWRHGTQTNSKPDYWTVFDGRLEVYPTPDAAYTIAYPSLRKASGIDAIAPEFRDVVVNGALAKVDPNYLPVFQRGLNDLTAHWDQQREEQMQFGIDADVEAHYAKQDQINVVS